MQASGSILTRFAPSLTGYLHLGHVLHMIYVWGTARRRGGRILARIEDHDRGRARSDYEAAILDIMDWLGFKPDLGITAADAGRPSEFRQSDCAAQYAAVLQRLAAQGLVYGCACSRSQITRGASGELCYDGTCAGKHLPLEGHTVRFRLPPGPVAFEDQALGPCRQEPAQQCGDFPLRDRHGQWTYQFCCVCDDIRQGINLVVRGQDILSSTGRQICLFEALGHPPPAWLHHPLLCDASGNKLSKRQRSESISRLRGTGTAPEEIIGRAAHAGGLVPEYFPLTAEDAMSLVYT